MKDKENRVVLAFGEVTGHAHAFYNPNEVELRGEITDEVRQLIIKASGAALEHEEHSTHTFEPGIADVRIQNEYQMGEIKRQLD